MRVIVVVRICKPIYDLFSRVVSCMGIDGNEAARQLQSPVNVEPRGASGWKG